MDQFDDLPDIVEKDSKPTFQTEICHNSDLNQQVANLFVPLFGDEPTEASVMAGTPRRRTITSVLGTKVTSSDLLIV